MQFRVRVDLKAKLRGRFSPFGRWHLGQHPLLLSFCHLLAGDDQSAIGFVEVELQPATSTSKLLHRHGDGFFRPAGQLKAVLDTDVGDVVPSLVSPVACGPWEVTDAVEVADLTENLADEDLTLGGRLAVPICGPFQHVSNGGLEFVWRFHVLVRWPI